MANTLKFGNGQWATGTGTALAYNDENANYKPLPFDFTRASSATVVNQQGLIETVGSGEPRIDFKDDAKGALLLEPTRSNLVTYSNDFSNASWNNPSTVTANTKISPSGLQNADTVTSTLYKFISATNGLDYTVSAFVKKELSSQFVLRLDLNTPNSCSFDLDTLTAGSGGKIEDYGNNWYRCSFTATATITATGVFYLLITSPSIYIFGAQLEQGSYATSYIPTQGSAVTRSADASSQTVPSGIIGQTEGVVYLKFYANGRSLPARSIIYLTQNGTTANRIAIQYSASGNIEGIVSSGGSTQGSVNYSFIGNVKVAFAYSSIGYELFVNGFSRGSFNGSLPLSLLQINLSQIGPLDSMNGNIDEIKLYNTRLSNAELQALTT